MSDGLVPDRDQLSVGPDLGANCLQSLSADNKSRCWQGIINTGGTILALQDKVKSITMSCIYLYIDNVLLIYNKFVNK